MTNIYHIVTQMDWASQQKAPTFTAPSLESEGFIHASRSDQIVATADRIFAGRTDLLILVIDTTRLIPEIRVEDSYGHGTYPHIYGPVNRDAITDIVSFPPSPDGTFSLPPKIQTPATDGHR